MSPKLELKPEDVECLRCGAPHQEHWVVRRWAEGSDTVLICPTAIFLPAKK